MRLTYVSAVLSLRVLPAWCFAALVAFLLALSPSASAAAGDADPTFDSDGVATTDTGLTDEQALAVAVQSDGRVLAGGSGSTGVGAQLTVVRYTADGSLDSTFGAGGHARTAVGGAIDRAHAIAVQTDGKIVAAGITGTGAVNDVVVLRYLANGALDTSFSGGLTITPVGGGDDRALAVAIQADGKIVIAGFTHNGTDDDVLVARYNANGTLDPTFGTAGIVTTDTAGGTDRALAVAIQADGKIVVAGLANNGTTDDLLLARYTSAGVLDTTFDSDGLAIVVDATGEQRLAGVAIQADGRIVATGSFNGDFAIWRFLTGGAADATLDSDGAATTNLGGTDDAHAIALDKTGRILVAGESIGQTVGSTYDAVLVRYNADGSRDTTFGAAGVVRTTVSGDEHFYAVAIDTAGRIVSAGNTTSIFNSVSESNFLVARHQGYSAPDPPAAVGAARGHMQATISWSGPANDGGSAVTSYTATAEPGGATCTTSQTSCTIAGLSNGTTHSFTVTASNGLGTSAASVPASVTPNSCKTPSGPLVATVDLSDGETPTNGNDVITGTSANDAIDGLAGDDTICGGSGNDTIQGGPGDDLIYGDEGPGSTDGRDALTGGPGNDTIFGGGANDAIKGGAGNDVVSGDNGNDTIEGGRGRDLLSGGNGNDTIDGGADNDVLRGHDGNDILRGGGGIDGIEGRAGNDLLEGGGGNDALLGGEGSDAINGGKGNDNIRGGSGNDLIEGGSGRDRILGGPGNDIVLGGAGRDNIYGDAKEPSGPGGNDRLKGGRGDDNIFGGGGNDRLKGGAGLDELRGAGGRDLLDGGSGNDHLMGGGGNDTLEGGDDDDLAGGGGRDDLDGGADDDWLFGGPGGDVIFGRLGDDKLCGGPGGDRLFGDGRDAPFGRLAGNGRDRLYGEQGRDRLYGGGGYDLLFGANGDTLIRRPELGPAGLGRRPGVALFLDPVVRSVQGVPRFRTCAASTRNGR